jgi:hypothetical protein
VKSRLLIALLIIMGTGYCPVAADPAQPLSLQVEGKAAVAKGDEARARQEAVKNALETAIVQACGRILSEKVEQESFQAVKSLLINRTDRYVNTFSIVSESRRQNDYLVQVQAIVALVPLRDDLAQMGLLPDAGARESSSVLLSVRGIRRYTDFKRLNAFLDSRPQIVKSRYPCRLEWQRMDCELTLSGPFQNFTAELKKAGFYQMEALAGKSEAVEIRLQIQEEVR